MQSKLAFRLLWLLVIALYLASCSSTRRQGGVVHAQRHTSGGIVIDKSGLRYVNDHKIVVGLDGDDCSFKRVTTIIKGKGKQLEMVRDCAAIAVIRLNGDSQDTLTKVHNVTVINRDTIEMHTKWIVDKYRDEIQTSEHQDRPYQYLRFLGMISEGEGNKLVNEGVIDIIFDHDPNVDFRVYGFGICGNGNSTFINKGVIRFHGKGSPLTRMRGMGSMADNVTFVNDGSIVVNVDMSEDARMITSGGEFNDIINNGTMDGRSSGTLLGMTRYGDSHIVNNGTLRLCAANMPEGYKSPLANSEKFVCGLMDILSTKRIHISPLCNRGTITIDLGQKTDDLWSGYGMYLGMVTPCATPVTISNDGFVLLKKGSASGKMHQMSECCFFSRVQGDSPINVCIGNWRTMLRDFKAEGDLFLTNKAIKMDFSKAGFYFAEGESNTAFSVAPESLLKNFGDSPAAFLGYDKVRFYAADSDWNVVWDKLQSTISLKKIK